MLPCEILFLMHVLVFLWTFMLTNAGKPALLYSSGYNLAYPKSHSSSWNDSLKSGKKRTLYKPRLTSKSMAPIPSLKIRGRTAFGPKFSFNNFQQMPPVSGFGSWGFNNQPIWAPRTQPLSPGWNFAPPVYANRWSNAPSLQPQAVQNSYWAPTPPPNRWQPALKNSYWAPTPPPNRWQPAVQNNYLAPTPPPHRWQPAVPTLPNNLPKVHSWMFPNVPTPPPFNPVKNNNSFNPLFSWRPITPAPMPWQKKPWPPPAPPSYILSKNNIDFDRYTFESGLNFQDVRDRNQMGGGGGGVSGMVPNAGGMMRRNLLDGYCVYPFNQLDTGCYLFSEETARDWDGAKEKCTEKKANLAKMESFNVAEVIKLFMRMQMRLVQSDEGDWQWLNNDPSAAPKPVVYTSWCEGEPKPGNRKCGALEPTPPSDRMCWRAEHCTNPGKPMSYMCEKLMANGMSQRRAVATKNFWRESFWLPGYTKVLSEYGNIVMGE